MKSAWEGWEKQAFGNRDDGNGNHCALGFLDSTPWMCDAGVRFAGTLHRVANYIRANYPDVADEMNPGGSLHMDDDEGTIATANNMLKLTPDDFRRIDLLTQEQESGMKVVQGLIESVDLEKECVR